MVLFFWSSASLRDRLGEVVTSLTRLSLSLDPGEMVGSVAVVLDGFLLEFFLFGGGSLCL